MFITSGLLRGKLLWPQRCNQHFRLRHPPHAAHLLAMCNDDGGDPAQDLVRAAGFRSPMHEELLVSTVRGLRLKHRCFQTRHQSHPRSVPGFLTVTQVAQRLGLSVHWLYDRLHNGQIQLPKDPTTQLFLFPDHPSTLERLTHLRAGHLQRVAFGVAFGKEYQDA